VIFSRMSWHAVLVRTALRTGDLDTARRHVQAGAKLAAGPSSPDMREGQAVGEALFAAHADPARLDERLAALERFESAAESDFGRARVRHARAEALAAARRRAEAAATLAPLLDGATPVVQRLQATLLRERILLLANEVR
jgi:hypothetical protein